MTVDEAFRELDLEPECSLAEAREAYRAHAKAWHPDRFSTERLRQRAELKLKRINEAFEKVQAFIESGRQGSGSQESKGQGKSTGETEDDAVFMAYRGGDDRWLVFDLPIPVAAFVRSDGIELRSSRETRFYPVDEILYWASRGDFYSNTTLQELMPFIGVFCVTNEAQLCVTDPKGIVEHFTLCFAHFNEYQARQLDQLVMQTLGLRRRVLLDELEAERKAHEEADRRKREQTAKAERERLEREAEERRREMDRVAREQRRESDRRRREELAEKERLRVERERQKEVKRQARAARSAQRGQVPQWAQVLAALCVTVPVAAIFVHSLTHAEKAAVSRKVSQPITEKGEKSQSKRRSVDFDERSFLRSNQPREKSQTSTKPVASNPRPSPSPSSRQASRTVVSVDSAPLPPMDFVRVPAGSFLMGSIGGQPIERPRHGVYVREFWIARYEVTQKQYEAVMGTNPSRFRGHDLPVNDVSYYHAVAFCERLTKRASDGWTYRLPTEAEWEKACRAGSETDRFFGGPKTLSRGGQHEANGRLSDFAWYAENSGSDKVRARAAVFGTASYRSILDAAGCQPHPVGEKQPNPLGLHDMYGNVWEWCSDRYYEYGKTIDSRSERRRMIRGGGCFDPAEHCRSSARFFAHPDYHDADAGFRVVRSR